MDRLLKEYPESVKIVTYHVAFNEKSFVAGEAALCAGAQGLYWEYHHRLFNRQSQWSGAADVRPLLEKYARDIGLDGKKFDSCLSSHKMSETMKKDERVRLSRSVNSTPTIFIGEKRLVGAKPYFMYKQVVDGLLKTGNSRQNTSTNK